MQPAAQPAAESAGRRLFERVQRGAEPPDQEVCARLQADRGVAVSRHLGRLLDGLGEGASVLAALFGVQPSPGRVEAQRQRLDEGGLAHASPSENQRAASAAMYVTITSAHARAIAVMLSSALRRRSIHANCLVVAVM